MSAARPLTQAESDVLDERRRQIHEEGWSAEHDDQQIRGELARAASCYALHGSHGDHVRTSLQFHSRCPSNWPMAWDVEWWKPTTPRRDLVNAAALILAEIDRLDRAAGKGGAS